MAARRILNLLKERFGAKIPRADLPDDTRLYLFVESSAIKEVRRCLFRDLDARYIISIGADDRPACGKFFVAHNFAFDREHVLCSLLSHLPGEKPSLDSITEAVPAASWAEREFRDLLGIEPVGHCYLKRLVLPDGWPDGVHPLRKDVRWDFVPPDFDPDHEFQFEDPPAGCVVVPFGPFHPTLDEPAHFRLYVEGEMNEVADVILLIYRLALCGIATLLAGLAAGSTYSLIGISREMMSVITLEPLLVVALVIGATHTQSFRLDTVLSGSVYAATGGPWSGALMLAVMLCSFQAFVQRRPFDTAEAETELMDGPLMEYSGPIWFDSYNVLGPVEKVVPVNFYIPGCPPRPEAILYGVAVALGLVDKKTAPVHLKQTELPIPKYHLEDLKREGEMVVYAKLDKV